MITVELLGNTGNQLFQYATLRSIALDKNYDFGISEEFSGVELFPDLDFGTYEETQHLLEEGNNRYNPDIQNVEDNTKLYGYFQSEKYFQHNRTFIQNIFKLETNIRNVCTIHIRGGDYKQGGFLLGQSYFRKAIEVVKTHSPGISFKIITDDMPLAKEYLPEYPILNQSAKLDFETLYNSKYKIISNSTFSWWASWLSDETLTIAPNLWMNVNGNKAAKDSFYPGDIKSERFLYI